jgi:hypothetical protein
MSFNVQRSRGGNKQLFLMCIFRGENILLFLVQTVGRQLVEQRQYRPSRSRSSANVTRKSHFGTTEMG